MDLMSKLCSRIPQRYFLAIMSMLGFFFANLNRFSLDLIFKVMFRSVKKSFLPPCLNDTHNYFPCGREEFLWGVAIQGHVQAAWMYGSLLGIVPLALLTQKFGAKTIFGLSILVPGLCSALTPVCARSSPIILIVVRMIAGFSSSTQILTQAWMAARWFPLRSRGLMLSLVYIGIPLSIIVPLVLNSVTITYYCMSWTFVCYLYGFLTVAFAFLWNLLIWDDPFDHPYISDEELLLLAHVLDPELQSGWSWPWKSILKSKNLWFLSIAHVGQSCFFIFAAYGFFLVYFCRRQGFCLILHMGVGAVILLSMAGGMIVGGLVVDLVVFRNHWLNITQITKTYHTINCVLGPLFLVVVTHSKCDLTLATYSLIGAFICEGIAFANSTLACLHMAPNFVATIMALNVLPGLIVAPTMFRMNIDIIAEPIKDSWATATYLNSALAVLTAVIFLQYGQIEPEVWNVPGNIKNEANDDARPFKGDPKDLKSKTQSENILSTEDEPGDNKVRDRTSKTAPTRTG